MICGLMAILALRPLLPRVCMEIGRYEPSRSRVLYTKMAGRLCPMRKVRAVDTIAFIGKVER